MPTATTYVIRLATDEDARALRRLGEVDSQPPLEGSVLIGEVDGTPTAALSLDNGRITANPFRHTEHLVACLHLRAQALQPHQARPALRERLRAVLPARHRIRSVLASATA
jgi:hypothetical protein